MQCLCVLFSFFFSNRCFATSAKLNEAPIETKKTATAEKSVPNYSFMANIFRGKVESSQVFPYPYYLTEEESETLAMVVDPVSRFFAVSSNIFVYLDLLVIINLIYIIIHNNKFYLAGY